MININKQNLSSITFIHFGNSQLRSDFTYNPCNEFINNKPKDALWASIFTPETNTRSSWEEYCLNNNLQEKINDFVLFRLKSNAKILILNSFDELLNLNHKYINKEFIYNNPKNVLNIKNISQDFHGLLVTQNCLQECPGIFGSWEVESIALFSSNIIVKLHY